MSSSFWHSYDYFYYHTTDTSHYINSEKYLMLPRSSTDSTMPYITGIYALVFDGKPAWQLWLHIYAKV